MRFIAFLKEALNALLKKPKLFVPKIVVAAIYGVSLVLGAIIIKDFYPLLQEALVSGISRQYIETVNQAMLFLVFTIFWMLFSLIADIFVNAMYPKLLQDFKENKRISLSKGFFQAKKRFFTVVPAALIVLFLVLTPLALISELAAVFLSELAFYITLSILLATALFFWFVFYYAYPVLVLERVSILKGLKKSVSLSRKNPALTIKASTIPFFISLFSFYLAFDIFNPINFVLFILTRFLISIAFTYHMVLNPILYFETR